MQQGSKQQLAVAAQLASAMFHGAQLWHQVQSQMWQRAGVAWRDAAEQIRDARDLMDLMEVQNKLWTSSYTQGMEVAQDLLRAALAVQPELQQPAQEEVTSTVDAVNPIVQAWQDMFTPAAASASRLH